MNDPVTDRASEEGATDIPLIRARFLLSAIACNKSLPNQAHETTTTTTWEHK